MFVELLVQHLLAIILVINVEIAVKQLQDAYLAIPRALTIPFASVVNHL